jgi:hypothetical protein
VLADQRANEHPIASLAVGALDFAGIENPTPSQRLFALALARFLATYRPREG